jgi:hypothetical protein
MALRLTQIEMNIDHGDRPSDGEMNPRPGQGAGGLPEGQPGGIAPGDRTDQRAQRTGAAQALQISHQDQGAIGLAPPAEGLTIGEANREVDRLVIVCESLQMAAQQRRQAQILERGFEKVELPQNGWQDGEWDMRRCPLCQTLAIKADRSSGRRHPSPHHWPAPGGCGWR